MPELGYLPVILRADARPFYEEAISKAGGLGPENCENGSKRVENYENGLKMAAKREKRPSGGSEDFKTAFWAENRAQAAMDGEIGVGVIPILSRDLGAVKP